MTAVKARGGDWSHHNGSWPGLSYTDAEHVTFGAFKVGEGAAETDPQFPASWARAKAIPGFTRFGYWYGRPEQSTAATQAARMLALIKAAGGFRAGDGILLDLEASQLTQGQTAAWQHAFVDYMRTHAPEQVDDLYAGGLAHNGSGAGAKAAGYRGLWFPRYRDMNKRTDWPTEFAPVVGINTTGLDVVVHQFSATFNGLYDADISPLTATELGANGVPVDPTPAPKDDDMIELVRQTGTAAVYLSVNRLTRRHVLNPTDLTNLQNALGVTRKDVNDLTEFGVDLSAQDAAIQAFASLTPAAIAAEVVKQLDGNVSIDVDATAISQAVVEALAAKLATP